MSTRWTEDQKKVIELRDRDLLVSAAAGSGKTAVLIERILGLITDAERPTDVDRLLVVTFTRAAAGEMRERLNLAIEKKLLEEENDHLTRQLTLIQNAQITTIDSFCSYVLKNYFHVIGLDPNYRVLDEGEGKLLKNQLIHDLLEEHYAEEEESFIHFVECMATGKNDQVLEEAILRLYEFAMSYPYPEKWLSECISAYCSEEFEDFLKEPWLKELINGAGLLLEDLVKLSREALDICSQPDGPYMYGAAIQADLEILEHLSAAEDYQSLYEKLEGHKAWARLSAKKDESVQEEKKNLVKALREQVKDAVKELKEQYFPESPRDAFYDLQRARGPVSVLVKLTLEFIDRFGKEKREKNLLDFHDMEHLALRILVKEENGELVPTDTARELSAQFEEIMIDEYQDSNLVQEAILTAVSRLSEGGHNLFMVGDVKQSIYRFRLARPELFMGKYQTYTKEESVSQRVDLSQNFRSRREILAFTNQIFREVMNGKLGGLVYDEAAALYSGAEYPVGKKEVLSPELLFFDLDESPKLMERVRMTPPELEARMTGQKILSLVGKEEVFDKETKSMRKMEFRDIVILFRSPSAFSEAYGKILGDMGIPVYAGSRNGYFSAREVQVVLALLGIIDNPSQDVPLAAVLLSPLGGISEKEAALIKSAGGEERHFFESCLWYAAEGEDEKIRTKLQCFYRMLSDFRSRVPYMPIHELLWYIFDYTGYEDYVSAMPAGEQRVLNLKMLAEKAWDYEKTSYRGLFNFIRYIENLKQYDVDYGEAQSLDEAKNVVRIMSIHKSKGLEFPVVILGGLEKQFNRQDTQSRLVLDVDLGVGFDMVDPIFRVRRPTLFKRCVQKKVRDDNTGEEIRVLYVALTRAREKLILTGVLSGLQKKTEDWYRETKLDEPGLSLRQLSEAGSYLDFIMPVLLKYKSAAPFLEEMGIRPKGFSSEGDPVWNTDFSIRRVEIQELLADELGRQTAEQLDMQSLKLLDPGQVYDETFRSLLKERLEEYRSLEAGKRVPMKLTVSQLKKQSEQEEREEAELLFNGEGECPEQIVPAFLKEAGDVIGAARGTAYHIFLQHLDFTRCAELNEVKLQLAALKEKGRLSAGEADCIDCRRIFQLASSELGRRMAEAQKRGGLFREQHFMYAVSAKSVYPEIQSEKDLLVQGVIDVYFEEEDFLTLVDYKTDFVKTGEMTELSRKYAVQLDYYKAALEQTTGKKVREKIIYSLSLQKALSV